MKVRYLGWAGIEIEAAGETLVIDPLRDAGAVFAAYGELARGINLPEVIPAESERTARAALVTHLHRDHVDAEALALALAAGAPIYGPRAGGGGQLEELATADAAADLEGAALTLHEVDPWTSRVEGPFHVTAVPAVDGSGDPQISWIVEADGQRIIHAGDTIWHAFWWRMVHRYGAVDVAFLPVNGAAVNFPHRQPASGLPAAMTPEHAAAAAAALQAGLAVPMHFDGFNFEPYYCPVGDEPRAFAEAAATRSIPTRRLSLGEVLDLDEVAAHGTERSVSH